MSKTASQLTHCFHFLRLAKLALYGLALRNVASRCHDTVVAIVPLGHADEHDINRAGDAGHKPQRGVPLVLPGLDARSH